MDKKAIQEGYAMAGRAARSMDEIIFTGKSGGPKPQKGRSIDEILDSTIALRDEMIDLAYRLSKDGKPQARKKVETAKEHCHKIMTLLRGAKEEASK
jgi:hypothetical protein